MCKKIASGLLAIVMLAAMVFALPGCTDIRTVFNGGVSDVSGVVSRPYAAKDYAPGSWAVYWYLCGTDLETEGGFATADLEEMLAVSLPANVTVVMETGGTEQWQNQYFDAGMRERHVYTGKELRKVQSLPLASMGDPNTLVDFLIYCNENYPAEKQMLVLWDHGGGSLIGVEVDELYDRDRLVLPELRDAIQAVPAASGAYEVVGFDACLMATVEMAEILSGSARYMVASQEAEPGIGWDYTGLFAALAKNTAMDGAQLGKAICDSYFAGCARALSAAEATLSVVDLRQAGALLSAYKAVGDEALLKAVSEQQPYFSAFGRAARDAEAYGGGDYEMVDLGDLVTRAGGLLPENGKTLLDALKGCVTYQVKGPFRPKASGLSCYYNLSGDPDSTAAYLSLGINEPYGYYHDYAVRGQLSGEAQDYIARQTGQPAPGPAPLPLIEDLRQRLENFPVSIGSDGNWQMDLGPELASNLAVVFLTLMYVSPAEDGSEGFRILWGTNRDLRADYQNGVFAEEFTDTWGSIDGKNVHMEPIGMEEGRILYAVPILLNSTTGGMGEWKADEEYSLHVGCTYGAGGSREYEILGAWKDSGEQRGMASKILRQLQPGDVIEPLHYPMLRNENNELYIDYSPMGMGILTVDENTRFYDRSVGDGYYALLFEMIDYAGNCYYSQEASLRVRNGKIERLPGGIKPATATQPPDTINGYYVSEESFHHDGRDEDISYYTIIIDAERYMAIAQALGLPEDGDSNGNGYTIQIYSDKLSLEPYVGMKQVYFKGECFPASTVYHQCDIVCNVESITEVW